jgi:hypothetical protein
MTRFPNLLGLPPAGRIFNPNDDMNRERQAVRKTMTRHQYTSRQLAEMADNAAKGIAPPNSPAALEIVKAEQSGDFGRAVALRAEVKELERGLRRLARARRSDERKTEKRRGKVQGGECLNNRPNP